MTTTVTVGITAKTAAAGDLEGTVTFTPSSPFYDHAGNLVVGTYPIEVTVTDGVASVALCATDDIVADDPTYTVTEAFEGCRRRTFKVEIPSSSAAARYEDLVEVTAVRPGRTYATTAYVDSVLSSVGHVAAEVADEYTIVAHPALYELTMTDDTTFTVDINAGDVVTVVLDGAHDPTWEGVTWASGEAPPYTAGPLTLVFLGLTSSVQGSVAS